MNEELIIKGARAHNLKNVDLTLPRNKLIVFTGLSGSGKSSLAFDTIYAEGQRRYVESLSSYARQFLGQMDKPDVDYIQGLSPAISIDQKTTSKNPRSTVGTITEVYDYLRLLYARIGVPHCPNCGREIQHQTVDQMIDRLRQYEEGTRLQIIAPVVRHRKGEFNRLFEDMQKNGYVRVRVDGEMHETSEEFHLDKYKNHDIGVIIDRIVLRPDNNARLNDSLESALHLADGLVSVDVIGQEELLFSANYACPDCGISIEELEPRMFSFNSPFGACPSCSGLGVLMRIDPDLVIPDRSLSINEGAIQISGWNTGNMDSVAHLFMQGLAKHYGFSLDTPIRDLPDSIVDILLYGTKGEKIKVPYTESNPDRTYSTAFGGIIPSIEKRYSETNSEGMKEYYESYMSSIVCPECHGERLKPVSRAVTIGNMSITQLTDLSVKQSLEFFGNLHLNEKETWIARQILNEIRARLGFLSDVGLEYLSLSRAALTLSGGEAQRIRLATQIGSSLVGVLYILDEPSIGLHQRDNARLLSTLKNLRDLGNTLIVVEHDEETMYASDYIVDIGPGAGVHGGRIVAQGTVQDILNNPDSITGQFLSGKRKIALPKTRRVPERFLRVLGASENNLKHLDVNIPLGVMTVVTGVSGSGKSSLVNEIVYKALARDLNRAKAHPGKFEKMEGLEYLDKVINIDQSPIGRTPRSNPATYTGVFDLIRNVFASTLEAKARGYKANRFSFNVKGGRCEACSGDGIIKIEMHFLPDVYVPCDVCKGKRYNRETLEIRYKEKNIYDVLDMTVEQALSYFENHPQIYRKIRTLYDVGLGYMKLGQPSTELSGGEAQRIKLATELSRKETGKTLYILDEPTTGLHMADVERLISMLQALVANGNSVLVIEHNLDVIKTADYVIDLGPEGGDRGGEIVAVGTPEEVAKVPGSYTGQWLRKVLPAPKE
ncbi:MAG: excinuclease ABC subunit UvrA [Clostridia bacterium]|nr:excinuclease ABC subunit UvrA [Clostridia bacterium]